MGRALSGKKIAIGAEYRKPASRQYSGQSNLNGALQSWKLFTEAA